MSRIAFYPGVVHGERIQLTGAVNFGSEPFLIKLGSDITIADGVRFLTHDGGARILRHKEPDLHVYAPIVVGTRVFIGVDAILLPGVTIGNDVIVGAGSVVTKDIPSGEVWAGVPARKIKSVEDYERGLQAKSLIWPTGIYNDEWQCRLEQIWHDRLR